MTTIIQESRENLSLWNRWITAIKSCNVPDVERVDAVTRWLVISRACVLTMILTSALIGILMAAERVVFHWGFALLSLMGLVFAHAANNLLNDYTDAKRGVDTEDYPSAQYSRLGFWVVSSHPIGC